VRNSLLLISYLLLLISHFSLHLALNAWFADTPNVGSGQYLKYLLPALLELDSSLHITLIAPKPLSKLLAHKRLHGIIAPTPFRNPTSNLAKVWFEQIAFPRMCRYIKVDMAHVPYFGSPLRPTCRTIVTIHDLIPLVLPAYQGSLLVRLYTVLVSISARHTDLIIADSEASRRDILIYLTMPPHRVRPIYLAPAPHYRPQTDLAALRQKYQLPDRFILYLGGFDVRKNVMGLLQAYAQLPESTRQNYPLVIAGGIRKVDTPFFPNPLVMAQQLGITIHSTGWVAEEDLPALYSAATFFVYPSQYEGFGLPVLEAMACGTPVITSNISSLPELAGNAALLIDPTNPAELAAVMRYLCNEPTLRADLQARGLAQVKQFSWAKTARQTLAVYNLCK